MLKFISTSRVDPVDAGNQARTLREAAGLTQAQVARKLGVAASYYNGMEQGKRCWTQERWEKFLKAVKDHGK